MEPDESLEAGERLIERLGERGVEYVFATFGTDHPTLIKGMAADDRPTPILAAHEMVAASAAHGYAQVTDTPGCVLVHVDVGTANLGASLHNANRSRVPLVIMAGRTPLTTGGDTPGSRSIFVHWYQDVADQAGIFREYTKWETGLELAENVDSVVDRALDVASADPNGPVYLTLPREILRQAAEPSSPTHTTTTNPATLDADTRADLVERIETAEHPLVITSYLGRDEAAVSVLEAFAETGGVPVVEAAPAFDLNFPRDHPLHFGFAAEPYFDAADLLLVVDCDVPWVPKRGTPDPETTVVHIDTDPDKARYPNWDYPVDIRVRADARRALEDLTQDLDADTLASRRERLGERGDALHREWRESVLVAGDLDVITPEFLSRTLGRLLGGESIVVDETVTNTPAVLKHCLRTEPGSYYSYCSSGLGWGLGAAAGIQLARPDETVVGLLGDGSFVLGNPVAALQLVQAYDLPHLWVIYNNRGWKAVGDAIADQYDDVDFKTSAFTQFDVGTEYADLATGLGCHGERVSEPDGLRAALERGLEAVAGGTHALVDVHVGEQG